MSRVEVTQETTPLSDGILKTDLPIDGTLQVVKDQLNNSSTLQISNTTTKVNSTFTVAERVNVESDSTVTTQTSSVISASTTNASLVIAPNGTGALMLNIPDGLTSGGNARGQYAVDLQRIRGGATQIASGFASVIAGGQQNRNSGTESSILGGIGNIITSNFGSIGGGSSNTVSSNYSTVSGGQSNTASTNTHATVVGGFTNTASGQRSIAGGNSNTASGTGALAIGGNSHIASGRNSSVLGGEGSTASGNESYCIGSNYSTASGASSMVLLGASSVASAQNSMVINTGNASGIQSIAFNGGRSDTGLSISFNTNSRATLHNQFSISNGVNVNGGSQASQLVSSKNDTLTTGGTTVLSLDGTGLTNLIIPNISFTGSANRAWNVQVNWVAAVTAITGTATGISVGDVITSIDLLAFKRISGTSSASSHTSTATKTMVTTPAAYAASSIAYTAGLSQEMALTFTGPTFLGGGSVTMRVVARVELSEVAWT